MKFSRALQRKPLSVKTDKGFSLFPGQVYTKDVVASPAEESKAKELCLSEGNNFGGKQIGAHYSRDEWSPKPDCPTFTATSKLSGKLIVEL